MELGCRERALGREPPRATAGWSGRWFPTWACRVELTGLGQRLRRDREEEIQDTFGVPPLPPRPRSGVAARALVGVEVPLPGRAFALLQAQVLLRYLPSEAQPSLRPAALASAAAGWRF